jgi:uncharacterized protein YjiK
MLREIFYRDRARRRHLSAILSVCLVSCLFIVGCATTGPNHIYLTTAAGADLADLGPTHASVRAILAPGERAVGLAYDFNTDHLFIRVAPAQVIRVVERPSGKILRNMPLTVDLRTDQPADLAIRSSDRHLFAVHPDGHSIVELTLFGEFVRRIELSGLTGPVQGLAYDQDHARLLVLSAGSPARVGTVSPEGNVTYYVTFATEVSPVTLGYDSEGQRFFVPLKDPHLLGEFGADGKLITTYPLDEPITAIDAGPRSFVRVF